MKFLTGHATPNLKITHRLRRCTVTKSGHMVLTESTLTLELTIPSILSGFRQSWRNVKTKINRAMRDIFVPDLAHFVACA